MPKPRGRGIGRDRGSGTENNRPRSRHRVASEIQFVIPTVAQSTQDVDADTDGGETAVAAEVEEVEQTQCSEKEGGSDLDRRLNALVKFLEVKEYSDRLAEDEDTEIEWEALSSSHDETATPSHDETASEHDTDASDVEDEDTRVLEQVPAVAAKQETAVAARIKTPLRLQPQVPLGFHVVKERYAHALRLGTEERHAMNSDPPAGPVCWEDYEHLSSANVNNVVLAYIQVGHEAEIEKFAEWCNKSTNHITVINLTSKDRSCGVTMRKFMRQCQKMSMHQMVLNGSGQLRQARVLKNASVKFADLLNKAVDTAVSEKFVLQLFDDTFVLFHRYLISNVRWCELDGGETAVAASERPQFGSLSFEFHADRQQLPGFTIGVVSMPDCASFEGDSSPSNLAKWIQNDNVAIVTVRFGKDNEAGIGETAVAAGASVHYRIRQKF